VFCPVLSLPGSVGISTYDPDPQDVSVFRGVLRDFFSFLPFLRKEFHKYAPSGKI
jgi:hypothetical protein